VELLVFADSAADGDHPGICVELATGGERVAGLQADLSWDESCVALGECRAAPEHGKSLFASQPRGATLRAMVLSLTNVEPIPGELLASHFEVGQPFFEVNGESLEYAASYFRLTQNLAARGGTATYPSPGDGTRRSGIEHDERMFTLEGTIEDADAIAR
jgi:hypothetical protein